MGKTALIFPGQGSQFVGMGSDLYSHFPSIQELYLRAEDFLKIQLIEVSFRGPEERLNETWFTQPALFVHSYAVATILEEGGITGEATAGHSLGEFSALSFAKVFSFESGLELVKKRAELMQAATKTAPGCMAAIIGLDDVKIDKLCQESQNQGLVQIANYNSPGQIVISGSKAGVMRVMELAQETGARRVIQLPVSGGFHSPLMKDAADSFTDVLKRIDLQIPQIPIYANVTAESSLEPEVIRKQLIDQMTHPVRWVEIVQNMIRDGVTRFIEVGAGKVLSGLVKRIAPNVDIIQCGTVTELEQISINQ